MISIVYTLLEVFVFSLFAIALAYSIDRVIPEPPPDEPTITNFLLLITQIYVTVIILFWMKYVYEQIFERNMNTNYGEMIFSVVFFVAQPQIFDRIKMLYASFNEYLM